MTNLISVDGISAYAGEKLLFENISFGINEGDKIALIGINGCGKSTLIRLLRGVEQPESGNIYRNNELLISYLEQSPVLDIEQSIRDYIFSSQSPIVSTIREYHLACEKVSQDVDSSQLEAIYQKMDRLNAWQYESEISSLLNELGVNDIRGKLGELSGGMLKKVNLAHCLLEQSNLLILDEPTNHLDVETILWLQNYLEKSDKAILLVTHDRFFLNEITNKIYEIDKRQLFSFQGNYDFYLGKKVEIERTLQREEEKARSFLRKELEWLKRQPKARATKQKAREDRAQTLMNRKKPESIKDLELSVSGRRLGKKILQAKNVCFAFGEQKLINTFNFTFKKNQRLGIIGKNGSGKSTLLNLLTGKLTPNSGSIDKGLNTSISYFDQNAIHLEENMRVIDFIKKKAGEYIVLENGDKMMAARFLEKFLFDSNLQYNPIGKLSGGERRRLYLVYLLMQNPNFLILDEPTNDLDVKTLSILEDFLEQFAGCLVIVSHDRYFMNRLVDTLLVFTDNQEIINLPGNYIQYFQKQKEWRKNSKPSSDSRTKKEALPKVKKLSYKEKREMENLEIEIEELEQKSELLNQQIQQYASDYQKIGTLSDELQTTEDLLLIKMERWEELNTL